VLADLARTEPFSFKGVVEVVRATGAAIVLERRRDAQARALAARRRSPVEVLVSTAQRERLSAIDEKVGVLESASRVSALETEKERVRSMLNTPARAPPARDAERA
jgi:hypothetical protein